jgi:thiol-disulfide isomerase/thioredoxin
VNNILIGFLIIQTAILIGILAINFNMVKEIKKLKDKNTSLPQPGLQPIVLKNNIIPPVNTKSMNLNQIVKVAKEEQEYVLAFVNPSCTACKELFSNIEIDQSSMKGKLIVVTENSLNMEFYDNILTNKGIPIIESKELQNHLGIRAFPTVIHIDKHLKVKEFFIGSNTVKFKEFIQSA